MTQIITILLLHAYLHACLKLEVRFHYEKNNYLFIVYGICSERCIS